MNKNLNEVIAAVERADALMFAIESCFLDFDILPEEMERANRGVHTFYALWVQSEPQGLNWRSSKGIGEWSM